MAKDCYWKGTAAGHLGDWSWDDAGSGYANSNWVDMDGVGIAKPVDGDKVVFRTGQQNVTAGLDQHLVTLASLVVQAGYEGAVGGSATPLKINVSGEIAIYGSAGVYWDGTAAAALIVCASANTPIELTNVPQVRHFRGKTLLHGSGTLYVEVGQLSSAGDSAVHVAGTYTGDVTGQQWSGNVTLDLRPASWTLTGGACTQTAGDAPTVDIGGSGQYMLQSQDVGGTLRVTIKGGRFDASKANGVFAVDPASELYAGAQLLLNNGSGGITGKLVALGQCPVLDVGTVIAINPA